MARYDYAKLRYLNITPFEQAGRPYFHLRDPLALAENAAIVPAIVGYLLDLCDGKHTFSQMQAEFERQTTLELPQSDLLHLLSQLDDAYLLDNERSATAKQKALAAYRAAEFRPPALAGLSYPESAQELRHSFETYLAQIAPIDELETGQGIFSPHIDYKRGGTVYARVWQRAAKLARQAECVIIFGTDHHSFYPAQITPTRQNYATPFGVLPTDQNAVQALVDLLGEETAFQEELHHRQEWSIELVLNWLHYIRQGQPCPIVPILCGSFHHFITQNTSPAQDDTLNAVISTLKQATAGRKTLVVASGDLAHLGPAFGGLPLNRTDWQTIQQDDDRMLTPLAQGNPEAFFEVIRAESGQRNVCGTAPFYLSLKLMGAVQGETNAYARCPADEQETSYVSVCGMTFA